MRKATLNFKKPIIGLQKVRVSSFANEIINKKIVTVSFEIKSETGSKLYADGFFDFVFIDLNTMKPTDASDWMLDLLFK